MDARVIDLRGCEAFRKATGVAYKCCSGCHGEALSAQDLFVRLYRMTEYRVCCHAP